ncbi:MAG: beta-ketoacyl-[acyl-carrier-protein] synthase family protein [Alphaproteobacteria bacterium]|nr:beta-ketoacyl-[acyl-carrier-protein] synthase family protein [Alphaproteobacteria bacterium]
MRRVVVTGWGMVTPLGADLPTTWKGLMAGRSGVGPIRRFDASEFPVTFAAEVAVEGGGADLKQHLTRLALAEALQGAVLGDTRLPYDPDRVGVCMGSEAARPALPLVAERMRLQTPPTWDEIERAAPHAPTRAIAEVMGVTGPITTVSTACTSSSQAVGEGLLRIRRGEVDAMVVGGVDVLVDPLMVTGFALLGALSTRNEDPLGASRPFDLNRDGFVLGEGAGMLILEEEEAALARGATPLVTLSGFGCSCNAYRITDSPPDGRGAAQAMSLALEDAGLPPEAIGYVNAHGTSTPMNDVSETRGIQRSFGAHRPAVSSTKSMMGHLVAACGAVEAIVTGLAIREGRLPPTINLETPDPECDLDHVRNLPREAEVEHALTNAFGFGGSNGTLVVSRWRPR